MIQNRRMQAVRQSTYVLSQYHGTLFQAAQLASDHVLRGGKVMAEQIQLEGQEAYLLVDGVMELTGDPGAFTLQQRNQLAGEGPQSLSVSLRTGKSATGLPLLAFTGPRNPSRLAEGPFPPPVSLGRVVQLRSPSWHVPVTAASLGRGAYYNERGLLK